MTGDLVNLGLPEEFVLAAEWLRGLGPPERVTAIPGNHDAYVRLHPERGTGHWQPYMRSNEAGEALVRTPPTAFPFVQRFGDVALVALSSAISTMPFIAAGRLGTAQRALLGLALEELGRRGLFRVVLIHHPPLAGQAGWRRGLRDAKELTQPAQGEGRRARATRAQSRADALRARDRDRPRDRRWCPVGVGGGFGRISAARYNEYRIGKVNNGWRCEMVGRAVADSNTHVLECERRILRDL